MFPKLENGAETLELLILQLGNRLALGERLRHRLAVELGQARLVIKRLQMGRPTGHAEKNHALGLGCKIGKAS